MELGNKGEEIASRYLEKNEYEIIARNFKCAKGEIDIIAKDKEDIVFIEVKTRRNENYGKPVDSVNFIKQKHIKEVSKFFMYLNNIKDFSIRYDIIEIYKKENKFLINHLKNLFW
ncbi:MAG: YraN family protein [Clostridia bacterium]|nr:YraN family protein [Clostridia bacterium]